MFSDHDWMIIKLRTFHSDNVILYQYFNDVQASYQYCRSTAIDLLLKYGYPVKYRDLDDAVTDDAFADSKVYNLSRYMRYRMIRYALLDSEFIEQAYKDRYGCTIEEELNMHRMHRGSEDCYQKYFDQVQVKANQFVRFPYLYNTIIPFYVTRTTNPCGIVCSTKKSTVQIPGLKSFYCPELNDAIGLTRDGKPTATALIREDDQIDTSYYYAVYYGKNYMISVANECPICCNRLVTQYQGRKKLAEIHERLKAKHIKY